MSNVVTWCHEYDPLTICIKYKSAALEI